MKKKTAYVAGSSNEIVAVRHVQQLLREAGFTITYDWTPAVEAWIKKGRPEQTARVMRKQAEEDLYGVSHASLFVLIAPVAPSFGAGVELGYALDENHSVVIGTEAKSHIFMHVADKVFCEPINDAVKHLVKWFEKGCPE